MTKVCFIANPAWPHVEKWARYFSSRPDYEVHLISPQPPAFAGAVWHDFGKAMFGPLPWRIAALLAYWRLLRKIRPDLLHVHNVESSFYPAVRAWQGPLVVTAYGLDVSLGGLLPEAPAVRRAKVAMLRRAEAVTAASHFLLGTALAYGGLDSVKGTVTPFGVDLERFVPQGLGGFSRIPTLGFFKDLKPEYGPLQFLDLLRCVRGRCGEVRAIMVGDGPLRGEVERRLKAPDLAGVVDLHGKLPHETMPEMYRQIDVCVMPSTHESFGVVALEAQAMEVPVVATRVEGLPEVVIDGTTGVLLDSNDPGPMAETVIRLLEDAGLRRSMGAAGRKFVERNFSLAANGRLMEEVYRSVRHA